MFMLANALVQVSGCVPDIICVAQVTLKFIGHTLISRTGKNKPEKIRASTGFEPVTSTMPVQSALNGSSDSVELWNLTHDAHFAFILSCSGTFILDAQQVQLSVSTLTNLSCYNH